MTFVKSRYIQLRSHDKEEGEEINTERCSLSNLVTRINIS